MAVKAVRNVTLALESNVRYFYFEAELTEDAGNWVEMKMQKNGYDSNKCYKRADNSVYSTDDMDATFASRSAGAASVPTDASKNMVAVMVGEWAQLNNVDFSGWKTLGWNPNA